MDTGIDFLCDFRPSLLRLGFSLYMTRELSWSLLHKTNHSDTAQREAGGSTGLSPYILLMPWDPKALQEPGTSQPPLTLHLHLYYLLAILHPSTEAPLWPVAVRFPSYSPLSKFRVSVSALPLSQFYLSRGNTRFSPSVRSFPLQASLSPVCMELQRTAEACPAVTARPPTGGCTDSARACSA